MGLRLRALASYSRFRHGPDLVQNMSIPNSFDSRERATCRLGVEWRWGVLRLVHAASASASALQATAADGIDRPLGLATGNGVTGGEAVAGGCHTAPPIRRTAIRSNAS
jgi:hypothetical protein